MQGPNLREGWVLVEAVLWSRFFFFSFTFILWNYVLSTKLGKEVNSNKRGLECTCFPCQVLEKGYSLHWASGNWALAGDVISRSTVSVCFTSIICEGSTDLNLLWFLPWDTFSLVWCPVQALQGFKVVLEKGERRAYKNLMLLCGMFLWFHQQQCRLLNVVHASGDLDLTC